jgi:hypothetical protein
VSEIWIRFLPEAWNTPKNRAGDAWGFDESAYILVQLTVDDNTRPSMTMVAGTSPKSWGSELWDLAKREKFKTILERTKKTDKYITVYSVRANFTVGENESPDTVATAERVWGWVRQEIEKPEFQGAVRIIAEHLEQLPEIKKTR